MNIINKTKKINNVCANTYLSAQVNKNTLFKVVKLQYLYILSGELILTQP